MRMPIYAKCMVIALLAGLGGLAVHAQSVADAWRQEKDKRDKKKTDAPSGAGKKKVYTNEDIPEAKNSDVQSTPGKSASAATPSAPTTAKSEPGSGTASRADDAGTLDFHLSSTSIKRPGFADVNWQAKNTSDHNEKLILTMAITGPCNYRRETTRSGFELGSGEAMGDNQYQFGVFPSDCAGTYKISMSLRAGERVLNSASATATVE